MTPRGARHTASHLLECVPNFSEGRDQRTIRDIAEAFRSTPNVWLLDIHSDAFHHRSVYTVVGEPRALSRAVVQAVSVAVDRVDLNRHVGEHPRVGAADVIPFISLGSTPGAIAVRTASTVGRTIAAELRVPVYLYGGAARRTDNATLPALRKRILDSLSRRPSDDLSIPGPDFGPHQMHPTAGASVIGTRDFLVAFNIHLDTHDVAIARQIASRIRTANGGPPGIRALGFSVERGAQVSMNLYDVSHTTPLAALHMVQKMATELGVTILDTELVGLMPETAVADVTDAEDLMLRVPLESRILERRMLDVLPSTFGGEGKP